MLTKNAVGNLINRYKSVLAHCRLMNTFGTMALVTMMALGGTVGTVHDAWALDVGDKTVSDGATESQGEDVNVYGKLIVENGGYYKYGYCTITVEGDGEIEVFNATIIGGNTEPTTQSGLWTKSLTVKGGGTYTGMGLTTTTINSGGILTVEGEYMAGDTTINDGGELKVDGGGEYTADATTINSNGKLTIIGDKYTANGATSITGSLTVNGGTYTANNGTTVNDGGKLTVDGGGYESSNGTSVNGELKVQNGSYTENGATTVASDLIVGVGGTYTAMGGASSTTINKGTLTIENGGKYMAESGTYIDNMGHLNVQNGGFYSAENQDITIANGTVGATAVATTVGSPSTDPTTGLWAGTLIVQSSGFYNAGGQTVTVEDDGKVDATANSTLIGTVPAAETPITGLWAKTLDVKTGGFYDAQNKTVTVSTDGTVTVADGTSIGSPQTVPTTGLWADTLEVSGGTYTANGVTSVEVDGTLKISGGTYTANGETSVKTGSTLTVSDTGFYDAHDQEVTIANNGVINVSGVNTNIGTTAVTSGLWAKTLNVQSSGFYNANGKTVTVSTDGKVDATLVATTIGTPDSDPTTGLWAKTLDVKTGGFYNAQIQTVTVENGGTVTVADATTIGAGSPTTGLWADTLSVEKGGLYNVGSDNATWVNTAVANVKLTAANHAIFAIAQAEKLTLGGKLNVGNIVGSSTGSASFGADSLLVIDGGKFLDTGSDYALNADTIYVAADAKLLISNAGFEFTGDTATVQVAKTTTASDLTIADGAWGYNRTDTTVVDTDSIFTDSALLGVTGVTYDTTNGTYIVTLGKVSAAGAYGPGLDKDLAAQIDALDNNDAAYDFFANTNAKGAQGAVALNVNGGTLPSVALASSSAVANIDVHNSLTVAESPTATYLAMNGDGIILPSTSREMTKGFGIWAMPMYKHSSADGFATGEQEYGFDANIYGMTLGADYTFDSNLRFGAALHVGTGTTKNAGDLPSTENNFDYFGMTAYAAKHFDNLALTADLGFTASSNDIDQAGNLKTEADAMLYTAGVKAEYLFDFKSFDLTPYLGARINHYTLEDHDTNRYGVRQVRNYAADATVVEFPMGLAIATDLKSGNWTLTPSASLGVKFAAGDLEADQEYRLGHNADTAVMTSEIADAVTFQGTLGLGMKKDVYSVDLGYTLDMSEHVQSHGLTVNLRYEF